MLFRKDKQKTQGKKNKKERERELGFAVLKGTECTECKDMGNR